MINRFLVRLMYGLLFALPLMLVSYAFAQANELASEPLAPVTAQHAQTTPAGLNCSGCHATFQKAWEAGVHSNATTDPVFQAAWQEAGSPSECLTCHMTGYDPDTGEAISDGVSCQACHDTSNANHPLEPMAADRSAKMCGECHNETYFEWQVSAHRESGLDCVGCHDPHATGLKTEDKSQQCASCHRSRASNFAHSEHSTQGLSCADCHLAELPDATEGHARLDHSFQVRLSTCNECHAYQMHDPSEVHPENPTPAPELDAMAAVETLSVAEEPLPVSPVGFATLSGLFGLAAGVILAPWLANKNRKQK